MKRVVWTLLVCSLVWQGVVAQEPVPRAELPGHISALSLTGSYIQLIWAVNVSYDQLWRVRWGYAGLSAGASYIGGEFAEPGGFGPHLCLTLLQGRNNWWLEGKIGMELSTLREKLPSGKSNVEFVPFPFVSLGCRFQRPGPGVFYRIALSNVGFGLGIGYAFGGKKTGVGS